MKNYLKVVKIDEHSITPKYLQVVNGLLGGIEAGSIVKGDLLPSINDFTIGLDVSKNTIERAYGELKKIGVIDAIARKGYFIASSESRQPLRVLLLFNKLSSHKKILYDAFANRLGKAWAIDFYIYHNDFSYFRKLLDEKGSHYSKVVIVPHFIERPGEACQVINAVPKEKLILLDKLETGITGEFGAVYEDFEKDIYSALEELLAELRHYHTLKIIFPAHSYFSVAILEGFRNFCCRYAFRWQVIPDLRAEQFRSGTAYINLREDDLVELVERLLATTLKAGKDIGIISYNESPIKKIILDGITTISTDFELMGKRTAELVLNNAAEHIAIPFKVTRRNSL